MKNRLIIAVTVFALVLVPCGKIAAALAKANTPHSVTLIDLVETIHNGVRTVAENAAPESNDSNPICLKSCKTWQGVMPRADDHAPLPATAHVVIDVLAFHQAWPKSAADLNTLGARSPPEPAGTAFGRVYATTSRFLG